MTVPTAPDRPTQSARPTESDRAPESDSPAAPSGRRGASTPEIAVRPIVQPAVRRVLDDSPLIPGRSADDSDTGWHEGSDSNDERLLRDVPPHW